MMTNEQAKLARKYLLAGLAGAFEDAENCPGDDTAGDWDMNRVHGYVTALCELGHITEDQFDRFIRLMHHAHYLAQDDNREEYYDARAAALEMAREITAVPRKSRKKAA